MTRLRSHILPGIVALLIIAAIYGALFLAFYGTDGRSDTTNVTCFSVGAECAPDDDPGGGRPLLPR